MNHEPDTNDGVITSYALAPTRTISTGGVTYAYREQYGGDEIDEILPKITAAKVAEDGKSVRLTISPLTKGHIHELHLDGVRSTEKLPLLHTVGYYTLNEIPAK